MKYKITYNVHKETGIETYINLREDLVQVGSGNE